MTKVDQLMALVDQLEAQLTQSRCTAESLVAALVPDFIEWCEATARVQLPEDFELGCTAPSPHAFSTLDLPGDQALIPVNIRQYSNPKMKGFWL